MTKFSKDPLKQRLLPRFNNALRCFIILAVINVDFSMYTKDICFAKLIKLILTMNTASFLILVSISLTRSLKPKLKIKRMIFHFLLLFILFEMATFPCHQFYDRNECYDKLLNNYYKRVFNSTQ